MKPRVLIRIAATIAALALAAPAAMAAHNTYDGYKSSYPQLHQLANVSGAAEIDLKSSYPQLHVVLSHQVAAPLVLTHGGGFDWRDAGLGALVGALGVAFLAAAIRQLGRGKITALR